jgi:protein-disulfide isomerase
MKRKLLGASAVVVCVSLIWFLAEKRTSAQEIKTGASPSQSVGNAEAKIVLEVFNDYQCPPCATFNEQLKMVREKFGDKVQIIFRNFPLSTTHQNAVAAAQAAEAAGLQGKFVEMIDLLYTRARSWSNSKSARKLFISYADIIGLDVKAFRRDLTGTSVNERIRLDIDRAKSLKVQGTPTALLNGEMLQFESMANLSLVIEKALGDTQP